MITKLNLKVAPFAGTLYDAMYLYGIVLARLINKTGSTLPNVYRDGISLTQQSLDLQLNGFLILKLILI